MIRQGVFPLLSCKLSDEQVVEILLDPRPQRVVGKEHGISKTVISRILNGDSYTWVAPHIQRRYQQPPGPRCSECIHHHRGRCSLDFPESRGGMGERAATICAAYAVEEGVVF
jgi:hypothetical protein